MTVFKYDSAAAAMQSARKKASDAGLVAVTGAFSVVAEIRSLLTGERASRAAEWQKASGNIV